MFEQLYEGRFTVAEKSEALIRPDYVNQGVIVYRNGAQVANVKNYFPIKKHDDIFSIIDEIGDPEVIKFDYYPLYRQRVRKKYGIVTTEEQLLTKEAATKIGDYLGCSFAKWRKVWNAIQYDFWIRPIEHHSWRFAFNRQKKPKASLIRMIWRVKKELDECLENGTYNISPFIFYCQRNPKQLKEALGKANWKQICKNSFSRNKKLAQHMQSFYENKIVEDPVNHIRLNFEKVKDLPSTAFDYYHQQIQTRPLVVNAALKNMSVIKNKDDFRDKFNLINDTYNMSRQIDEEVFKFNWSLKKIKEKHDKYKKIIDARKHGDGEFPYVGKIVEYLSLENFEAKLLKTGLEVGQEGRQMHHCVGMYSKYCYAYERVVYSVTRNGEKYSTLSFRIDKKEQMDKEGNIYNTFREFKKDQHYKMQNKKVDNPIAQQIESILLEKLNDEEGTTDNRTNVNDSNNRDTVAAI